MHTTAPPPHKERPASIVRPPTLPTMRILPIKSIKREHPQPFPCRSDPGAKPSTGLGRVGRCGRACTNRRRRPSCPALAHATATASWHMRYSYMSSSKRRCARTCPSPDEDGCVDIRSARLDRLKAGSGRARADRRRKPSCPADGRCTGLRVSQRVRQKETRRTHTHTHTHTHACVSVRLPRDACYQEMLYEQHHDFPAVAQTRSG